MKKMKKVADSVAADVAVDLPDPREEEANMMTTKRKNVLKNLNLAKSCRKSKRNTCRAYALKKLIFRPQGTEPKSPK